jgi:glycerate dehydrogenase
MATARKLAAFGCTVLVDDRHPDRAGPYRAVPLDELLSQSNVVSVHLPLTDETRGIVGAAAIARMQPGSLLVNTGRGHLVAVAALARTWSGVVAPAMTDAT